MIYNEDIINLKTDISNIIGQKIMVRGTLGRSKIFEKEAVVEHTYSNWFQLKYDDEKNDTYTYKDVLTHSVELEVFDGEQYIPLLPPVIEPKRIREQVL